jgi:hypothetical protein
MAFALNLSLNEDPESFYLNLPEESSKKLFSNYDLLKQVYDELSQKLPDIVDAWDFDDVELVSVLGKKSAGTDDTLYSEILKVVRHNPLNQKIRPKGFMKYAHPVLNGKL